MTYVSCPPADAAIEMLLEMSSDAPLPPAHFNSETLQQEAPRQSDRPSNLSNNSQESVYHQSGLSSLHPAYRTECQPPYYYAGPQQKQALTSPSLYQDPSQSVMPNTHSLYSSASQPLASPRPTIVPVQQGEWPLVCADTQSSMQAATEIGRGQTAVETKRLLLLRGLPGSGKSTLARYPTSWGIHWLQCLFTHARTRLRWNVKWLHVCLRMHTHYMLVQGAGGSSRCHLLYWWFLHSQWTVSQYERLIRACYEYWSCCISC